MYTKHRGAITSHKFNIEDSELERALGEVYRVSNGQGHF